MLKDQGLHPLHIVTISAIVAFFLLPPEPAGAYLYDTTGGGAIIRWDAGSPAAVWNDGTKTLSWSFNRINFPQTNWPSAAAAGAAFQNSYLTMQDTNPLGTTIKFNRLSDTNSVPTANDGRLQMSITPTPANDYYGTNITRAFAVTYVRSTGTSITDADIVFNGGPTFFTWSTSGPPAPAGTNDIEVTSVHEQYHSIGSGHPVYYYSAVWWTGRYPETLMYDRCLGPDDRLLLRTLYPAAPATGIISGTVTVTPGGALVDRAVVVATDAAGIPQAAVVTAADGTYTVNVPTTGTPYTISVHHGSAIPYNSDIDFTGATNFLNCTPATVAAVPGTGNVTVTPTANPTATTPPTLGLTRLAASSVANLTNGNATQTLFLSKGVNYTLKLEFTGATTDGNITGVNFGPTADITVTTGATTASNNAGHVVVAVTANVAAGAVAGVRNITAVRGAERVILPSFVEVLDTGALAISAGPENPVTGSAPFGAIDRPLLQLLMMANNVEDIRIRKLQFNLAGSGPALTKIKLWKDVGTTPGTVDGTDIRIFSGNAYANVPVDETIPGTTPGTILFDNLALTIPRNQTVTILLTADIPATGNGSYTASFNPAVVANITPHGMYWGDVCVPTGTTVTGGILNIGLPAVGSLAQIHTSAPVAPIPVGGSTNELQVTLQGVVTASTGTLGMEVEAKQVGTAFDGIGTQTLPTTSASGTTLSINVTGLTSGRAYHWRARALSSVSAPSAWVSFGANAETAVDFNCDTSMTGPPPVGGMQQFQFDGVTIVPLGGTASGYAVLQATTGTNTQNLPLCIEVEVQPTGTPFTGNPQLSSGYALPGTPLSVLFTPTVTSDYHWQARCASQFGNRSGFTNFNAAPIHFHLNAIQTVEASAGCMGKASESHDGGGLLWIAAGATLLLLTFFKGGARKAAASLVLVLCIGAAAQAEDDRALPRSLAESFESPRMSAWPEAPDLDPLLEPEPLFAPVRSFMTVDAYFGFLLMDMDFSALGTDLIQREVSGIGTAVLGIEALLDLGPDFRLGLAAEVAAYGDIRIIAVGPVGTWCFSGSHRNATTGLSDTEHYVKLGLFYEKLTVTKNNFGNFDASFGVRLGYELRISLGDRWGVIVGAALQYSEWDFSESIIRGDDKIGGFGGLITVGAAWLP